MQEPAPKDINPSNMVDQNQKDTEVNIANNLNKAGLNVKAEDVSAQHNFPPNPLQELGGEIVAETNNAKEFIKATTTGSNYVRTTPSEKIISIASIKAGLKNRFLRKKAA